MRRRREEHEHESGQGETEGANEVGTGASHDVELERMSSSRSVFRTSGSAVREE